jgi:hypothetical protein
MSKNPNNISATFPDAYSSNMHVSSTGNGLWSQITQGDKNIYDPYTTLSISANEKEYLETIVLAADLLAGQVISPQDFFKLKLLLKSKDEEVRNTAIIFLNQKAKL